MALSRFLVVLVGLVATPRGALLADSDPWSELQQPSEPSVLSESSWCVSRLRENRWSCNDDWTHQLCPHSCQGGGSHEALVRTPPSCLLVEVWFPCRRCYQQWPPRDIQPSTASSTLSACVQSMALSATVTSSLSEEL